MKTSYFFSPKLNENDKLVSISGLFPPWFKKKYPNMRSYDPLKPPKKLVFDYKDGLIPEEEYVRVYNEILSKLDPERVYNILKDSILLCWETPDKFCHRKLVAEWIKEKLEIEVEEL